MSYRVLDAPLTLAVPDGVAIPDGFAAAAERAWATAAEKLRGLVERRPGSFPLYTSGGRWAPDAETWTNWGEGFLAGQLWMLSARSDDAWFREEAERYSLLIEPRKRDREVHDLGFLFWSSWRRWFELTGDPAKEFVVVHAGKTLSLRFNEQGRYLRSFLAPESLFIDIMANVGIIFHAAARSGDERLARVAHEHCRTTRRVLVRGDGSVSHEGIFDPDSGRFLRQTTQQGFSDDGSWARGQAWAIHGFATAYRWTGDRSYLDTAARCADFYVERTADRLVPPNDWEEPDPQHRYESSAAAIAAGGLWQLAGLVGDEQRARDYGAYALRILRRLCEPDFLASDDPEWEGVLKHGIYHETKGLGVDESVMWGDYFLLDALESVEHELERAQVVPA